MDSDSCFRHKLLWPKAEQVIAPIHQVHAGRTQESCHEGVGRVVVDLLRGSDLAHLACVHDDNAVPQTHRFNLVVGDKESGDSGAALEAL